MIFKEGDIVQSRIHDEYREGNVFGRIGKVESFFGICGLWYRRPQYLWVRFTGFTGLTLMSSKSVVKIKI
jgi:hypothetical protein